MLFTVSHHIMSQELNEIASHLLTFPEIVELDSQI